MQNLTFLKVFLKLAFELQRGLGGDLSQTFWVIIIKIRRFPSVPSLWYCTHLLHCWLPAVLFCDTVFGEREKNIICMQILSDIHLFPTR